MLALLTFLFFSAHAEVKSCLKITDDFCAQLHSPQNLGNFEKIRLGNTANDIKYSKFFFLKAVERNFKNLSPDMKNALQKGEILQKIKAYTQRKPRTQTTLSEVYRTEWSTDAIDNLSVSMVLLANERTEKKLPGFIRETIKNTTPSYELEKRRTLDEEWVEFFQRIWEKDPAWVDVTEKFERIRQEYLDWVKEDQTITKELKLFRLEQLQTLKLDIPGSVHKKDFLRNFRCAVDEENAYYDPLRHSLTICAGAFTSSDSTQIIAHEIGHSISHTRRILNYLEASDLGKNFFQIWDNTQKNIHLSSDQLTDYKKNVEASLKNLKPYKYDDDAYLRDFVTRDLKAAPGKTELNAIAVRLAKKTLKEEIRYHIIDRIIKKDEVIESGRVLKNEAYLNPQATGRWPLFAASLLTAGEYFDLYFIEEYNCQANEKKIPAPQALENALIEAQTMTTEAWKAFLTVGGRYSFIQEAIDEEIAQDIEEDVVDSYGSKVMARILSKMKTLDEKRKSYLNSLAFYCNPISFTQIYPEEARILNKLTGAVHSVGQDRRKKLLTDEIRPILQCD